MDVSASLEAPHPVGEVFALVDELTDYPAWMPLAHAVSVSAADDLGRPQWAIELRARVGPFARSKRLTMVRTVHDPSSATVRFERNESDGRRHAPWILDAFVRPIDDGSRLDMHLHYGGKLWTGGVMERVLVEQIVAGRERLLSLLATAGE